MSDIRAIEIPKWGMTMEEGVVDVWHLSEGQSFAKGDALCTVESSKISNDLEAPFDGYLRRIVATSGETLPVGALIAVSADPSVPDAEVDAFIASRTTAVAPAPAAAPVAQAAASAAAPVASVAVAAPPAPPAPPAPVADAGGVLVPDVLRGTPDAEVFATPHALKFATEHGVALGAIVGSGPGGRVSLKDVEDAIVSAGGRVPAKGPARRDGGPARSTRDDSAVPATPVARRLAASLGINLHDCRSTGTRGRICRLDVEEAARRFGVGQSASAPVAQAAETAPVEEAPTAVPFTSMRRTIAQRLQASAQTSPHFRVHQEIVLDDLLALRAQINASVPGVKISVNDLIVKGVATALMRVPDVNVQFDEASQSVLRFAHADVAVAVAIDEGLITPIVRRADVKPISQISRELSELITRAKAGRLTPDEFQGGTFSVSNLGMLGVTAFDAIINPPQAAILAVGAGIRRPVVLDSGEIAARTVLEVSMSSDHRVIDGALAATFVGELKAILESPAQMLV